MTQRVAEKTFSFYVRQCSIRHSLQLAVICSSRLINNVEKKSEFVLFFYESPVFLVRVMVSGKSFSVQKTLTVFQLCQKQDGLNYVITNNVIEWV